jgi:phage gpG-like protein
MATRITIEVDDSEAQRRLAATQRRSQDLKPVFQEARVILGASNAANFASNGLPVGGWAPRQRDHAWPPLVKTGRLFNSLANLRGAPNEINKRNATFGTNVEYAKFHQSGTRQMPKRQIVFEPLGFRRTIAQAGADHIIGVRRALLP